MSTDSEQDTLDNSSTLSFQSVQIFEESKCRVQRDLFLTMSVSKSTKIDSYSALNIMKNSKKVLIQNSIVHEIGPRLLPTSESVLVFNESKNSPEVVSIAIPEDELGPQTAVPVNVNTDDIIGLDVASESNVVSQIVPDFKIGETGVLEPRIEFEPIANVAGIPKSASIVYDEKAPASDTYLEPRNISQSISSEVIETIAALEQDTVPDENADIESDTVIEIIAKSEPSLGPIFESEEDSEPLENVHTDSVSEQNMDTLSTPTAKETIKKETVVVLEIEADSEPIYEPKPLKISFPMETTKGLPNILESDRRFRITFDTSKFIRDNISIDIIGDKIDIYGITESESGEYHEIHQIFAKPMFVCDKHLIASFLENEILLIEAPLKTPLKTFEIANGTISDSIVYL